MPAQTPATGRIPPGGLPPGGLLPGGAGMISAVLPAVAGGGVAAVETFTDELPPAVPAAAGGRGGGQGEGDGRGGVDGPGMRLFPAEEATLGRAVEKRRREFTTGRLCAHRALAALGVEPVPILPGPRREPLWPAGVVGSITHCAGYRAAAVARADVLVSLGIDAEPNGPTPGGVLGEVALPEEQDMLARLARDHPGVCWDRLLFSAKESVYKAWFPLARRWLGFADARLAFIPDPAAPAAPGGPDVPGPPGADVVSTGVFTARLLVEGPSLPGGTLTGFTGRWVVRGGLIVTGIAVRPGQLSASSD